MALAMLQCMRLAYPTFREQLQDVIDLEAVDPYMKVAAQDLQCMCEFIIPTVSVLYTPNQLILIETCSHTHQLILIEACNLLCIN